MIRDGDRVAEDDALERLIFVRSCIIRHEVAVGISENKNEHQHLEEKAGDGTYFFEFPFHDKPQSKLKFATKRAFAN